MKDTAESIKRQREQVSNLKAEMANIPKGPKGKAARQAIAQKAKALLAEIKARQGDKAKQVKSLKEAQKVMKERKAKVLAEIKSIRESVKSGRTEAKKAVETLGSKVTANATAVK